MKIAQTSRRAVPLSALPIAPALAAGADPALDALAAFEAAQTGLRRALDAYDAADRAYKAARPSSEPLMVRWLGLSFITLECFDRKTLGLAWRTFPDLVDCRRKLVAREKQEAAAAALGDLGRLEAQYSAAQDAETQARARVIAARPQSPAGALALLEFAASELGKSNTGQEELGALQNALARAVTVLKARLPTEQVGIAQAALSV